jgi:hypothetical protein
MHPVEFNATAVEICAPEAGSWRNFKDKVLSLSLIRHVLIQPVFLQVILFLVYFYASVMYIFYINIFNLPFYISATNF